MRLMLVQNILFFNTTKQHNKTKQGINSMCSRGEGWGGGIEGERVKNPTEMVAKGRYFHLYITIQIACVMM